MLVILSKGYVVAAKSRSINTTNNRIKTYYPFANHNYVVTVKQDAEYFDTESVDKEGNNCTIYFEKLAGKKKSTIWKRRAFRFAMLDAKYEDYNEDGTKDLVLYSSSGARGGNEYDYLFLIDPKMYTLTAIRDFELITNPTYDQKNHVILSLGLSGKNYYSLYRISKKNRVYQIGSSFEDIYQTQAALNRKIKQVLGKKY